MEKGIDKNVEYLVHEWKDIHEMMSETLTKCMMIHQMITHLEQEIEPEIYEMFESMSVEIDGNWAIFIEKLVEDEQFIQN
jgi:hypothetical protein